MSTLELTLTSEDYVLLVTPYTCEISMRIEQSNISGSLKGQSIQQAFYDEVTEDDPNLERFKKTVGEHADRYGLVGGSVGADAIVLHGAKDNLDAASVDLDQIYDAKVLSRDDFLNLMEQAQNMGKTPHSQEDKDLYEKPDRLC